jgi:uncharacterized protein
MKILVSGSSGLIGSALLASLQGGEDEVVSLVRREPGPGRILWDPAGDHLDARELEGMDAVVHLAGENIAGRWTRAKKERIRESRVRGTGLLSRRLAGLARRPGVLVCASAIGYYGDRGDELLAEGSSPGSGFLASVVRDWEAAAGPAAEAGIRVVSLRFGVVLSVAGGALARMLTPFKLGLGGVVGSGSQYMSWISLDDVVGIIRHAVERPELKGPVNAVAPQPVTNREFTRALGRALSRPTIFPMPATMARLAFGEMAQELLLGSTRVNPDRLRASGYRHRHANLDDFLGSLLS